MGWLLFPVLVSFQLQSATLWNSSAFPPFSWDRVPRYAHCSNRAGLFKTTDLNAMANLSFIVLEKYQGLSNTSNTSGVEQQVVNACAQIKQHLGSVSPWCLFYFQMDLARTQQPLWYQSSAWFDAHNPTAELHLANGSLATVTGFHVYDYSKPLARAAWVRVISDELQAGVVDGVFVDGFRNDTRDPDARRPIYPYSGLHLPLATNETQIAWLAGLNLTQYMLRDALGPGTLIINNPVCQP